MNPTEAKETIASEIAQLEDKIDRQQLILDTYVGNKAPKIVELEKNKAVLETWQKCMNMIEQI